MVVSLSDGPTSGMTLVDWWDVTPDDPNATVIRHVDADGFFKLLVDRIGRLGR